jgi:hypothetical protein
MATSWRILPMVAALSLCVLTGCETVSSTSRYFVPLTTGTFPPLPKDAPVAILGEKPERPYDTVGELVFTSEKNWPFFVRSIEYNARRHGADAAILRNRSTTTETLMVSVPPTVDYVPFVRYVLVQKGNDGKPVYVPVTDYFPIVTPGYLGENEIEITSVDALLIRFRDSQDRRE